MTTASNQTPAADPAQTLSATLAPNALYAGRRGARLFDRLLAAAETTLLGSRQFLQFRRELKAAARPVRRPTLRTA